MCEIHVDTAAGNGVLLSTRSLPNKDRMTQSANPHLIDGQTTVVRMSLDIGNHRLQEAEICGDIGHGRDHQPLM
jgi:hypothetical protein